MKNLVIFNYGRFLKSKVFMLTSACVVFLVMVIDISWIKTEKEIFLHWVHYGILILYIGFVNIYALSIIIIEDINNGIVSLEVRKGIDYRGILLAKLCVVKSISFGTLGVSMFIFYLIIQPLTDSRYIKFEQGHLIGYAAIIGLDIFLTGLGLFVGAFRKQKTLISTLGVISGLFVFSPIIAEIHLIPLMGGPEVTSRAGEYVYSLFQKEAQNNPEGLLNFLYKNLQIYNNQSIVTISKHENSIEDQLATGLTYEAAKEDIDQNGIYYLNYTISIGQPLLLPYILNNSSDYNRESSFAYCQEYLDSKIYKFIQATHLDDQPTNRNPNWNVGYMENSVDRTNIKTLLNDYITYLKSDEKVKQLEEDFGLKNLSSELDLIEKLLNKIMFESGEFYVWKTHDNEVRLGGCDLPYKHLKTNTSEIISNGYKSDSWLYNGNQLFIKLLFNLVAKTGALTSNTGENIVKDSIYNVMKNDSSTRNLYFVYNPFVSFPYMSLFSGNITDPIINNDLSSNVLRMIQVVQDVLEYPSANADTSSNSFKSLDALPISEFVVTRLVIPTYLYYLPYLFLGFCFGTVGLIIYQRKIRP